MCVTVNVSRSAVAGLATTLVALGISGLAAAHHVSPDFETLRENIERIRVDTKAPGAAVVIVDRSGIVWSAGFGVADNVSRRAVTPDTMFRIGSITKVFTAAALLRLARREDFSLDQRVSKYLPNTMYFNRWESERPLIVAHLLEHTSGFRDWTKAEFDHNTPLGLEQGLAFSPRSRTAHWKPGLHYIYSNSNYGLAGLVLERVSGEPYETVLRNTLFDPLEMHSATSLHERTRELASGYDRDGITPIPYWHIIQRPAAAINTTPRHMAAMVSMLLNNGRYRHRTILTRDEVERLESPTTSLAARNGLPFGYGLGVYAQYRNGFRFIGHGGDADGYLSRFAYCRRLGVGYFVVTNTANPGTLGRLRRAIENALTRDHLPPPAPAPASVDPDFLRRYTGRYALAAWRFDWQKPSSTTERSLLVHARSDGSLFTQDNNGKRRALLPVTQQAFRRTYHQGATSGFFDDDGALYFQDEDNWVKVEELIPGAANRVPKTRGGTR